MITGISRRAHPDHGFSLIEVIAGLAIIALGLAGFCQAIGNASRASQRSNL